MAGGGAVTGDLQWIAFAVVGVVTADLMLRAAERRRLPVASPPNLLGDPTRVALLGCLPFAIRLIELGRADARSATYPPVTLPLAAWSVWVACLLLLAVPVLISRRRRRHGNGPLASLALGIAAVVAMGVADSPFDRPRLDQALERHEAYCLGLRRDVPEQLTDIRADLDREIAAEIEAARKEATALFESRGTPPALDLLEARRVRLEAHAGEWRRKVELRRQELEEERRRQREAQESSYYLVPSRYN
jgi:hypothetical protein